MTPEKLNLETLYNYYKVKRGQIRAQMCRFLMEKSVYYKKSIID